MYKYRWRFDLWFDGRGAKDGGGASVSGEQLRKPSGVSESGRWERGRGGVGKVGGAVLRRMWPQGVKARGHGDVTGEGGVTVGEERADRWAPPVRGERREGDNGSV
jgi:hypothetical protein